MLQWAGLSLLLPPSVEKLLLALNFTQERPTRKDVSAEFIPTEKRAKSQVSSFIEELGLIGDALPKLTELRVQVSSSSINFVLRGSITESATEVLTQKSSPACPPTRVRDVPYS